MICNTRNRGNDTTESQKETKTCFNAYFQYSHSKITGLNSMWSLKCESRTSSHAVQYKWQEALLWCFFLITLRMASLNNFFFCSVGHHKMHLFIIIHIFSNSFCNRPILFVQLANVHKLWNNNLTVHMNKFKTKPKQSHVTFKLTTRCIVRAQWYH